MVCRRERTVVPTMPLNIHNPGLTIAQRSLSPRERISIQAVGGPLTLRLHGGVLPSVTVPLTPALSGLTGSAHALELVLADTRFASPRAAPGGRSHRTQC